MPPFLYYIISSVYDIFLIYYFLIIIYFIMSWIPPIRNSKFYYAFSKIVYPFTYLACGRLIVGGFDLGGTIGLIIYAGLLRILSMFI